MLSINKIKKILKNYKASPRKTLGQNFLISEKALEDTIKAAELKSSDKVLEVGPGLGFLTKRIAPKVKKVKAVEKDEKFSKILKERLTQKNIEIINEDILDFSVEKWKEFKVVANLPFSISTEVIRKFIEKPSPPQLLIFLLQEEVGKKICASGSAKSKLSIFSQAYGNPEIIKKISKGCFYPSPKVDSVLIRIKPTPERLPQSKKFREKFAKVVKAGFSHPRKQLPNSLSKALKKEKGKIKKLLSESNIDPKRRAETLSVKEWIKLTKKFKF